MTRRSLGALVIATVAIGASVAASYAATPTPPFTECPAIGADPSCALLIDVTPAGATVTADPASPGPYDGSDDTLVGIKNDSTASVASIPLSSTTLPILGFDGDGLCTFAFTGDTGCPFDSSGYGGPGVSFSAISPDGMSGVVNFSPAIAPGGSAYFSLEEAITPTGITVAPPAAPPTATIVTPADGSMYTVGDVVDADYSCTAGTGGTLSSCDGPVADGSPIDTTTAGTHSFVVTAADADNQTASAFSTYTVRKAPTYLAAPPLILHLLPGRRIAVFEVQAKLTYGAARKPLAGKLVSFTAGSAKLCSATTGTSGTASCTYGVGGLLASALAPLSYQASFSGDGNYGAISVKAPVVEVLGLRLL
ncbi:MAG TPA: hypothetical protein VG165_00590 [Solirubrobacteraceae bacterium]|jgi:hypothetical protein|nr:hypothetical protein [Solirubrobacteraceae bacterium]